MSKAHPFETGIVTISLDTEVGWGRINSGRYQDIGARLDQGKSAIRGLLDLFDEYALPVTWAVVGQLARTADSVHPPETNGVRLSLDSDDIPWENDWWHAPELVQAIERSDVVHELGSHSGNHLLYTEATEDDARADIRAYRDWCADTSTPATSFVFPQNKIGHRDVLASEGIRCYRGKPPVLGSEPTPTAFLPRKEGALVNLPASVAYRHYSGRNTVLNALPPRISVAGMKLGVKHAALRGRVFHLVLHPHDFTLEDGATLRRGLERWLQFVDSLRERGEIRVETMGSVASNSRFSESAERTR